MGDETFMEKLAREELEWWERRQQAEARLGIVHVDGISWAYAPLPRQRHRCRAQTTGRLPAVGVVERCACGGMRIDRRGPWTRKNERRNA